MTLTRTGFTKGQTAALIAMGIGLWFAAAVLLRVIGPMGAYEGWARAALYGLLIPGTVPFIYIAKALIGFRQDQIALAASLMTGAAMLCDGVALAYVPTLYGGTDYLVAGAGAAILWGAGVAVMLGFMLNEDEA